MAVNGSPFSQLSQAGVVPGTSARGGARAGNAALGPAAAAWYCCRYCCAAAYGAVSCCCSCSGRHAVGWRRRRPWFRCSSSLRYNSGRHGRTRVSKRPQGTAPTVCRQLATRRHNARRRVGRDGGGVARLAAARAVVGIARRVLGVGAGPPQRLRARHWPAAPCQGALRTSELDPGRFPWTVFCFSFVDDLFSFLSLLQFLLALSRGFVLASCPFRRTASSSRQSPLCSFSFPPLPLHPLPPQLCVAPVTLLCPLPA